MHSFHAGTLAAIAILAAGCATSSTSPEATGSRIDIDSYRLLADLALARQQPDDATGHYLSAAMISDDPAYAERAAQMAYQFGLDAPGHRAISRWRALSPGNRLADYYSGVFQVRSSRIAEAVNDFSALLDSLSEAEIGVGYLRIFDALSNEPTVDIAARVMYELTSRFPHTRESHYAMSQLAMRAGGFSLALAEAESAVELDPEWPDAQLLYARALLLSGRSDEALAIASDLAELYDETPTRLQFAQLLLSAGETERAEALLNAILDENPGMPEAIRALAYLRLAEDELDAATESFQMLRSDPNYRTEAFYYLGVIAETEAEYLRATRSYSRVTDGIRAVEAQTSAARILHEELGDTDSALRHLQEFGNANPRFIPEMVVAQALLHIRMDQTETAIEIFDAALNDSGIDDDALRRAHVDFYTALMDNALEEGDIEAADRWINEGLLRYPGDQILRYAQARLLQEQGRMRRAVGLLEDLVDESPDNAIFLNALGYLLTDKLDRHNDARDYIQRALALQPDSGAILDSMGWVLFHLGEFERALDFLERAYRDLEVTEVMAHLIDVHWALGNESMALEMLEQALAETPDDPWLTDVRDRLMQ